MKYIMLACFLGLLSPNPHIQTDKKDHQKMHKQLFATLSEESSQMDITPAVNQIYARCTRMAAKIFDDARRTFASNHSHLDTALMLNDAAMMWESAAKEIVEIMQRTPFDYHAKAEIVLHKTWLQFRRAMDNKHKAFIAFRNNVKSSILNDLLLELDVDIQNVGFNIKTLNMTAPQGESIEKIISRQRSMEDDYKSRIEVLSLDKKEGGDNVLLDSVPDESPTYALHAMILPALTRKHKRSKYQKDVAQRRTQRTQVVENLPTLLNAQYSTLTHDIQSVLALTETSIAFQQETQSAPYSTLYSRFVNYAHSSSMYFLGIIDEFRRSEMTRLDGIRAVSLAASIDIEPINIQRRSVMAIMEIFKVKCKALGCDYSRNKPIAHCVTPITKIAMSAHVDKVPRMLGDMQHDNIQTISKL